MSTTQGDEEAKIDAQILKKYPYESNDITLSPVCQRSRGKVNGEDVEFCYRIERRDYHHTGVPYDCLSWQKTSSSHADDCVVVAIKHIAGIHTIGGRGSSEYSLIFLDPIEDSDASHTPTVGLKIATLEDPPENLLSDFQCPEEPEHLLVPPTSSAPNLHIIVSAGSDADSSSSICRNLVLPFLEHFSLSQDEDYTLHCTTSASAITDLVGSTLLPRATQGIAQTIFLLGGDDGVSELLNALLSGSPLTPTEVPSTTAGSDPNAGDFGYVRPTLVLIPCGTKNALAHSNFIIGNRMTKHSTFGLRAALLGGPEPLPFFRTTFSPGGRLLTDRVTGSEDGGSVEAVPTIYGAIVASWGLHASISADGDISKSFREAAEEALCSENSDLVTHTYKGKVTLFNESQNVPISDGGIFISESVERLELKRREHACVLAAQCAFLEEGFEISPEHELSSGGLRVVEFGPSAVPKEEDDNEGDDDAAAAAAEVIDSISPRYSPAAAETANEITNIIRAAYDRGKHTRDKRVGYYNVSGMRIEIDDAEEDERWRRFCVDGKIIVVERGGWMEVREVDVYREGVLNLVVIDWETSEMSQGQVSGLF